jgi:hypothetical protein
MAGGSLKSALARRADIVAGPLTRVVLALDAAKGMEYLHSKVGVVCGWWGGGVVGWVVAFGRFRVEAVHHCCWGAECGCCVPGNGEPAAAKKGCSSSKGGEAAPAPPHPSLHRPCCRRRPSPPQCLVHFDLKSANLLLGYRDRRPICKVGWAGCVLPCGGWTTPSPPAGHGTEPPLASLRRWPTLGSASR